MYVNDMHATFTFVVIFVIPHIFNKILLTITKNKIIKKKEKTNILKQTIYLYKKLNKNKYKTKSKFYLGKFKKKRKMLDVI